MDNRNAEQIVSELKQMNRLLEKVVQLLTPVQVIEAPPLPPLTHREFIDQLKAKNS